MVIWIVFVLVGGLLFVYFNFKIWLKCNISISFIKIKISYRILKKEYVQNKKIYYVDFFRKTAKRYSSIKSKKIYPYLKHLKKAARLFIVKNIYFYPECIDDVSSFAFEFMIVNNVIKRPILRK
ncbi:hypothetical protein RBQ61_11360 [Sedimentibacter sp. MB35-C1]|uniref:hypothetical protein n=1 Tax=Sedimentibacter sp. MB35-C1 TaxID=3070995 RepID=UPI0027E10D59|nr:hypothetical protein [Sedimentibacter sp. MB35-C1]WMJ76223.1 hypothetical protein RBQ61_11360 [Sedimentibacter sp. MB35-C1]